MRNHFKVTLFVLAAVLAGCQPTAAPPAIKPVTGPLVRPAPVTGPITSPTVEPSGPSVQPVNHETASSGEREVWSVFYMQDQRVGFSHVVTRPVQDGGRTLLHTHGQSELTLNREGSVLTQRIELQTWETPEGKLERFQSRRTSGPGEIVTQGKRLGAMMLVATESLGKRETKPVPFAENCGGYFAAEQSLERSPLKAGESRTVPSLVPVIDQQGEIILTALGEEEVSIRGLTQQLMKVKSDIKIAGQTLTTFCWIDSRGQTLKTFDPSFKQEAYKTTREFALAKEDLGKIDLLAVTTVPLTGKLRDVRPLFEATYVAKLKGDKIANHFANDEFQQVTKVDDHTVRLTIAELDRLSPVNRERLSEPPTPEDSAPNSLVQSDDAAIVRLANSLAGDRTEPFQVALALAKGTRAHISKRTYAQAFATAAEVVRTQEGDCTEHAVLLAALCRARKIPARVVLGLVYYPPQKGFAYHMWNEVWVGNRWFPLDATVVQGTVGADHIKLRHASLHGESAYAVMLPLLQVVGRLELEVVEVE
ncbi:Transglutaminase-like superfamily protein [Anatilimnocola aggregata]|uniref:Transglutaminase-like superfamily protein n=1 Tax=Anatilimnocola aggregata TaxID=2528021 RepID=A0A517YAS3_9BACT|nr:transglutaminase family protein [Anatilimnocola aggregata]QDU27329.1 Transglutaminase-like superfamily protein [Anatilimnocola aggregata]